METIRRFASLFWGRHDAYFESFGKGGRTVYSPPNLQLFRRHLLGEIEIGTYPVRNDARCRWGCIDIDEPDEEKGWQYASDLWSVWRYFGVTSWIEVSRSKGYHCWVFAMGWTPSLVVREAGLYVNSISGGVSKEINPKASAPWLLKNGLVNTVRTPYSGRAEPGRMVVVDAEEPSTIYPLADFVDLANRSLVPSTLLVELSEKWRSSVANRKSHYVANDAPVITDGQRFGQSQDAYRILKGERQASPGERDQQFWTIANLLHARGTTYELAIRIVESTWREMVPEKWDFPLSEALEKVERLYSGR